ncbi:hypothetical protein H4582DRAFT_1104895 [Lactarius indigo]|nr:hypothetical protein H4582DRAFT_1104895 [Lactarius indigo]
MERARQKDSMERDWSHVKSEDEWGPTMTIEFVLLRTPLLSPHDPETIVVSQELSADPSFPEILWNFSRYKGPARITLEQNPHFYLRCPADESAYSPKLRRRPLKDPRGAFGHNDTVYVLFDRPGRVFLTTEHKPRIFGNVWSLNGSLIFRDGSGVLEGEQLVRGSSARGKLLYREQPVGHQDTDSGSRSNRRRLWSILTTSFGGSLTGCTFEDWKFLSCPTPRPVNIYIYSPRGSLGSTSSLDLVPPPPTSERPGYPMHYMTIDALGDVVLLDVFSYFRPDNTWNVRLGWCKLSHVCQRWRRLIHTSAFRLGTHILCTNGTPMMNTLDHLPPFPLFVDYRYTNATIMERDELGICYALRLRDRIRRLDLHLPHSVLHKLLMLMDEPFSLLEHLSLSFTADKTTILALPKTFLAPNLRHLALVGISLPKRLRALSFTISLVTLVLMDIRPSGYFRPGLLVARLQPLLQLEKLSIGFSIPIPRPSTERELLGRQRTPVTLPNLKYLRFQGVGTYLESLVAQIRAPLLERLDITLFNQIVFTLPHLSHFVNMTEKIKPDIAELSFGLDAVSITMDYSTLFHDEHFILRVICKQLDWQIDCAAQICNALMPVLSGVEILTLDLDEPMMPIEWQNGKIDPTAWHELLRSESFIRVKELRICNSLSEELSRALQVDEIGSDPELLPSLRKLVSEFRGVPAVTISLFHWFIRDRRVAGRLVHPSFPHSGLSDRPPIAPRWVGVASLDPPRTRDVVRTSTRPIASAEGSCWATAIPTLW